MRIIGCDLHARLHTLAMRETATEEVVNLTGKRECATERKPRGALGNAVGAGPGKRCVQQVCCRPE
jgi:hypothetical protein